MSPKILPARKKWNVVWCTKVFQNHTIVKVNIYNRLYGSGNPSSIIQMLMLVDKNWILHVYFLLSENSILRWTCNGLMKTLWWESDEKVGWKISDKFQLQTYIWKYLDLKLNNLTPVRLEPSTSGSSVRCFIHCTTEPTDVQCKAFLYNIKQRKWLVLLWKVTFN